MQDAGQPPLARICLAFALGIIFMATGASKLIDHAQAVADFHRWAVPAPSTMTTVVGIFELCGAALLMANIATRRVAMLLAAEMAIVVAVAGRADGGAQLIVPPAVAALCLFLAWTSRPERSEERVAAR
jgi:uncharacterized membrane protein YphA (DoxX/SURF4 family)